MMGTSDSLQALRRANPRGTAEFESSVSAATAVRAEIDFEAGNADRGTLPDHVPVPRRRRVPVARVSLLAAATAAATTAAVLATGLPGGNPVTGTAAAAVVKATDASSALADQSGTAMVRMTHDGQPWTAATIHWNGRDLSVSRDVSGRRDEFRVVAGTFYGIDPFTGRWAALGSANGFEPGSGTTPREYLATVTGDASGATLHRIVGAMTGLSTRHLGDGSTVYSGTVPAGVIARERGFKEGQPVRLLPFGYVVHDQAANPASPLDAQLTVGADGIIRQISVRWGTRTSAWTYTVTYSNLGHTPAPVAPPNPLTRDQLRQQAGQSIAG